MLIWPEVVPAGALIGIHAPGAEVGIHDVVSLVDQNDSPRDDAAEVEAEFFERDVGIDQIDDVEADVVGRVDVADGLADEHPFRRSRSLRVDQVAPES